MAQKKISQLPQADTPSSTDKILLVQSGVTDYMERSDFMKNVDADATFTDITTNNVSSTKHGYAPKSPADATQFLNGAATPAFAAVKDSDLSTSDVTTNNASTSKHGFLKKLDNNAAHFMDGTGAWSVPTGTVYTDEQAQDAVGTILDNGTVGDVNFTYDDATPKISGVVKNGAITEAKQTLADNTTGNASTSAHGYVIKATAPSSGVRNVVCIDNGETVYKNAALVDSTAPANIGTAASGSQLVAARRDHVHSMVDTIEIVIDGGGSAITTGVKLDIEVPFACTITQATLLADQSGSIVIDIWKDTYANYPPTVADTITASAKPTLSSAAKSQDSTLTGWTTSISAGDTLRFNVDSITTCQRVTLSLKIARA